MAQSDKLKHHAQRLATRQAVLIAAPILGIILLIIGLSFGFGSRSVDDVTVIQGQPGSEHFACGTGFSPTSDPSPDLFNLGGVQVGPERYTDVAGYRAVCTEDAGSSQTVIAWVATIVGVLILAAGIFLVVDRLRVR